ncbi:MAG TPA: hypothetical protein VJN43_14535 [Bryobacteraceae bacterium]|nr:hypothetical protein [Bryobacteraceae bacterium]
MDHETAVRLQAAERYVLREFSSEERRAFEDHYFGCAECASEVRAASILGANLKSVLREDESRAVREWERKRETRKIPFFWPLAASAALNLALLAGLGYQSFGIKSGIDAQFFQSFAVPAASRGEIRSFAVPAGSRFFGARFDLPPGHHFESFSYQILDSTGRAESAKRLDAPGATDLDLELAIPVEPLKPGVYQLILQGTEDAKTLEISRARFTIQPRKGR